MSRSEREREARDNRLRALRPREGGRHALGSKGTKVVATKAFSNNPKVCDSRCPSMLASLVAQSNAFDCGCLPRPQRSRKVDVRLPGKRNSNSYGARLVYQMLALNAGAEESFIATLHTTPHTLHSTHKTLHPTP